jgi:chorismate synthase
MASNRFGNIFTISTFGESHGVGVGVLIDGCPSGISITTAEIQSELDRRRPGLSVYTTERKELDEVEILSGFYDGITTGAPILIFIKNVDADSSKYEEIKDLLRPGHANFTYLEKYGVFDYRGGGRASARETAARVAAGAIAKKIIYPTIVNTEVENLSDLLKKIEQVKELNDSIGGIIKCEVTKVKAGLGDPIYQKLNALLAFAMMSIPAARGVEFGLGFESAFKLGSESNDEFFEDGMRTNHHGGVMGGISSGNNIEFRVAFKATSSIKKKQRTTDLEGRERDFVLPEGSRHDPCVALRAKVVVEAMTAIVLADLTLMNRCSKL